jgi:hypothetical protein
VKLPDLNIAVFDMLACVLQRCGVIARHEVIAPDDLTSRSHYERSIARHAQPQPQCFVKLQGSVPVRQLNNSCRNRMGWLLCSNGTVGSHCQTLRAARFLNALADAVWAVASIIDAAEFHRELRFNSNR